MNLDLLKQIVIGIALVTLIAAATAIALDEFGSGEANDATLSASCNHSGNGGSGSIKTGCGTAYNITQEGLQGTSNATGYLDTIGTIAGVAVLLGIVVGAFYFMQKS